MNLLGFLSNYSPYQISVLLYSALFHQSFNPSGLSTFICVHLVCFVLIVFAFFPSASFVIGL